MFSRARTSKEFSRAAAEEAVEQVFFQADPPVTPHVENQADVFQVDHGHAGQALGPSRMMCGRKVGTVADVFFYGPLEVEDHAALDA